MKPSSFFHLETDTKFAPVIRFEHSLGLECHTNNVFETDFLPSSRKAQISRCKVYGEQNFSTTTATTKYVYLTPIF